MLLLAIHNSPQPRLDLRGVSGALDTGLEHVHVDVAVADDLHGGDEVLLCQQPEFKWDVKG